MGMGHSRGTAPECHAEANEVSEYADRDYIQDLKGTAVLVDTWEKAVECTTFTQVVIDKESGDG